jgi:hypothetical protein
VRFPHLKKMASRLVGWLARVGREVATHDRYLRPLPLMALRVGLQNMMLSDANAIAA